MSYFRKTKVWNLVFIDNALKCEDEDGNACYYEYSRMRGESPHKNNEMSALSLFDELSDGLNIRPIFIFNGISIKRVDSGFLIDYDGNKEAFFSEITLKEISIEKFLENINSDYLSIADDKKTCNAKDTEQP